MDGTGCAQRFVGYCSACQGLPATCQKRNFAFCLLFRTKYVCDYSYKQLYMKILTIVRHAAASCSCSGGDHERELDTRGMQERQVMARAMVQQGISPDMIICSTAVRARSTAEALAKGCGIGAERIVLSRQLYLAEQDAICTEIACVPDTCLHLLLVGHNPGLSDFVAAHTDLEYAVFPTCGLVSVDFAMSTWADIFTQRGIVSAHLWPDMYE